MPWLTKDEVRALGFCAVGDNVLLSNRASYYNCEGITIGDSVRIDDFCVLSAGVGGIFLGRNIHLSVFVSLIGAGRITLHDFSTLSSRVSVYSSNDDYSGAAMTNPMVPAQFTNVTDANVTIGRHAIVGSGAVILPGVTLEEGSAIGALSLVTKDCDAFTIWAGVPAIRIGSRKRDLLELETRFRHTRFLGNVAG